MIKLILSVFLVITNLTVAQVIKTQLADQQITLREGYDSVISKAALAIDNQKFVKAKELYQIALALRPHDPFAFKMIKTVDNNLKALAEIEIRNNDLKRKADINTYLQNADAALTQKNLDTALTLYIHILSLHPIKSQEEFVIHRIKAIGQSLASSSKNKLIEDTLTKINYATSTEVSTLQTSPVSAKNIYHDFSPDVFKKKIIISAQKNTSHNKQSFVLHRPTSSKASSEANMKQDDVSIDKTKTIGLNRSSTNIESAITHKTIVSSPSSNKADANTRANIKDPVAAKKEKAYQLLMYSALKAINLKKYKEARNLYQKMININAPNVDKASIEVVIKSIDDVLAKDPKKGLK
jgi:tetratricopeptide (TPR) repeat protein